MSSFDKSVDIDVSAEIITKMISIKAKNMRKTTNPEMRDKIRNEIRFLAFERREMFKGNTDVLNKILTVYPREIKRSRQR